MPWYTHSIWLIASSKARDKVMYSMLQESDHLGCETHLGNPLETHAAVYTEVGKISNCICIATWKRRISKRWERGMDTHIFISMRTRGVGGGAVNRVAGILRRVRANAGILALVFPKDTLGIGGHLKGTASTGLSSSSGQASPVLPLCPCTWGQALCWAWEHWYWENFSKPDPVKGIPQSLWHAWFVGNGYSYNY